MILDAENGKLLLGFWGLIQFGLVCHFTDNHGNWCKILHYVFFCMQQPMCSCTLLSIWYKVKIFASCFFVSAFAWLFVVRLCVWIWVSDPPLRKPSWSLYHFPCTIFVPTKGIWNSLVYLHRPFLCAPFQIKDLNRFLNTLVFYFLIQKFYGFLGDTWKR